MPHINQAKQASGSKKAEQTKSPPPPPRPATPATGHGLISRNFALFMWPILKLGFKRQVQLEDLNETWPEDSANKLGHRVWSRYKSRRSATWPSLHNAILSAFSFELAIVAVIGSLNSVIATPIRSLLLSWLVRDTSLLFVADLEFNKQQSNSADNITASVYSLTNSSDLTAAAGYSDSSETIQLKQAMALYALALLLISWSIGPLTGLYLFWQDRAGMRCRLAASKLVYEKSLRLSQQTIGSGQASVGQMVNLLSNDVTRMEKLICVADLAILPLEIGVALAILVIYLGLIPTIACALSILSYFVAQTLISRAFSRFRARIATCTDKRVQLMHEFVLAIQTIKLYSWEMQLEKDIEQARRAELKAISVSRLFRTLFGTLTASSLQLFMFVAILSRILVGDTLKPNVLFLTMELVRNLGISLTVFFPEAVSCYAEFVVACRRCDDFLDLPETTTATLASREKQTNYTKLSEKVVNKAAIEVHNVTCCWSVQDLEVSLQKSESPVLKQLSFTVKQGQLLVVGGRVGSGKSSILLAIAGELPISSGRILANGSVSYCSQEAWIFAGTIRQNVLFGLDLDEPRYLQVLKVCALEQDLASLPAGDQTLTGERGTALSGGQRARVNLARALYRQADIYLLDDPLSAVDAPVAKHIVREAIWGFLKDKTVVVATHQLQHFDSNCTFLILDKETTPMLPTDREDAKPATAGDTERSDAAPVDTTDLQQRASKKSSQIAQFDTDNQFDATSELSKTSTSTSSYVIYLRNAVNPIGAIMVLLACLGSEFVFQSTDFFLTRWAERFESEQHQQEQHPNGPGPSELARFNQLYGAILMLGIMMAMARIGFFYWASQVASRNIHRKLLASIVRAPMQFFDSHPMGDILNRFSRDLGLIDEQIPLCMTELVAVRSVAIAGSLVTTILVAPSNALPSCLILICLVVICWANLGTVVRLRELDNSTKSDIFSHLATSVAGLATIRAFERQQHCLDQFCKVQDTNTKANFAYISASSLVGSLIYLSSMVFITVEIWFNVGSTSGGHFGLLVVRLFYVQAVVQWWARLLMLLEGQMASVKSVAIYSKLQAEQLDCDDNNNNNTNNTEPLSIKYKNVSLRYPGSKKYLTRAISFTVAPGERLAIMGRTGAGKSTLIACLLRLYAFEGSIKLDNIDTKQLCLSKLRAMIGVIPQQPVLFAGTIRRNLDPANKHADADLWAALDAVLLRELVEQSTLGLDFELHEGGSNLSLGQQQLLCLARVILRRNKVLVLDEASASVDLETERQIKLVVAQHFKNCTQITIAHRLATVLDCDRLLVLDGGKIVELGEPWRLAQDVSSHLSKLLDGAKQTEAAELRRLLAAKAASGQLEQRKQM